MTMHSPERSRPGISLLEVLTAIFIMGVGLLALLTLFPLGALSMARAVRDDRAAVAGANAAALANAFDLRNDAGVAPFLSIAPPGPVPFAPPDPNGPGYPVYVDPMYQVLPGGGTLGTLAGTPGLARTSPSYTFDARSRARWFVFQDEVGFETTGQTIGNGAAVIRPGTYSYAYLLRRPRSSSPALTDLSVVVYANRATDSVSGENTYPVNPLAPQNATSVTFTFTGDKPNIRKGGWILDSSYRLYPNPAAGPYGTVNGYFYRVASVTDGAGTLTLELETPLKENMTTLVVMDNVITVLDRGTSWLP